jgi:ParB/RepB/Spo0J family partition protein
MYDLSKLPTVPLDKVQRNVLVKNIRKTTNEKTISELADSIATDGLLAPPIVMVVGSGTKKQYHLVAGFRRLEAIKQIRETIDPSFMDDLPYIPFEGTDEDAVFSNAKENLDREDLNDVDLAEWVYDRVTGPNPMPQSDLAKVLHRQPSWVSMRVTFMENACALLIAAVRSGDLSFSAGYELSKLDKKKQEKFLKNQKKSWDKLTVEDVKAAAADRVKRPSPKLLENKLAIVTNELESAPHNEGLIMTAITLRYVLGILGSEDFEEGLSLAKQELLGARGILGEADEEEDDG